MGSPQMTSTRTAPAGATREWLSLGPASRLVGVDPDTLRRWSDEGRLPTFTTPGRHRRFDRKDLELLVLARRPAPPRRRLADLGATPDRLSRAYARSYASSSDARGRVGGRFDGVDRDGFRMEGRRLVGALLDYLDAGSAKPRARAESDAIDAVRATAARLSETGSGLDEAVEAFIAARRPFLAELATLGRRRSLDVTALTSLYDEAVGLLDRLLLEFLMAFNSSRRQDPVPSQGVPR